MAITDVLPLSLSVLKKIKNVVTEFNSWSLRTYFQHSEHKFELCVYFSATNYFFLTKYSEKFNGRFEIEK